MDAIVGYYLKKKFYLLLAGKHPQHHHKSLPSLARSMVERELNEAVAAGDNLFMFRFVETQLKSFFFRNKLT